MTNLHARGGNACSVSILCELLGVRKQAYYKRDQSLLELRLLREEIALQYIRDIRSKDPGMGGTKLWHMYCRNLEGDRPIGRDHFLDIIDRCNLKVRKVRRKTRTTDSAHGLPTYPNLVKEFIPTAPNQLWVSDITYIVIWDNAYNCHFCYLSLILDAYTEEIVGWYVGKDLSNKYPIKALEMALHRIEDVPMAERTLTHHSDRGCQYASLDYVKMLKENNIAISMTECGDPKDNAQAERINNTMKNELLKDMRFASIGGVIQAVERAVAFYNEERPHMSLDMMTPREAASCKGEIPKKWISHREKWIKDKQNACTSETNFLPLPPGSPHGLLLT